LDLREEAKRPFRFGSFFAASVVSVLFFVAVARVSKSVGEHFTGTVSGNSDNITAIGNLLFTRYLLPFEVTSILLLVAMIGAILLSKKELK
jgi:NADH-quinone oxidoreductase subunit J